MLISVSILLVLAVAGVAARIAIFHTPYPDQKLDDLLDGHLPIQGDLLFWKLWQARSLVDPKHRWRITAYFWLTVAVGVALPGVVFFSRGLWW